MKLSDDLEKKLSARGARCPGCGYHLWPEEASYSVGTYRCQDCHELGCAHCQTILAPAGDDEPKSRAYAYIVPGMKLCRDCLATRILMR